ncbi:RagB/SusD family nutrient uptake outer membrane protein [Niabella ginsengisoli]|uniref:RagB/SusD family nutrient uptake outer membrane protein n=1 Tax=Niabella ginsengisoli TaxID=522298 RepID=A0ABS9SM93_9BACT|nr:RagB/SusD family nutrient uptake outer membrane protein [Niabella ginsengisoli]MCH5599506.1 RagB/SusD family nutrient uptake outer membrane protein [Niabella ginsengisoli]
MQQLRSLMDNAVSLNSYYPFVGAIASDDYYITEKAYTTYTSAESKSAYAWGLVQESAVPNAIWVQSYKRILAANTVLDHFDNVDAGGFTLSERNAIKGEALFYRGFNFFQLSQVYAMPYHQDDAAAALGIPLKLSSDINEPISRATLAATFDQIIADLQMAISLLPASGTPLVRPNKIAAYAALSNVYLVMGRFTDALQNANAALALKSNLMDYNDFSLTTNNVIPLYNEEIIWQAELSLSSILNTSRLIIDSNLYRSYLPDDLRKPIFLNHPPRLVLIH